MNCYNFGYVVVTTLKKQRRIDTDNRIKAAAVEVFAEYGYERAQLSYMSKIAGISIGLIGQNFGSKQDLFMSVVRDVLREMADLLVLDLVDKHLVDIMLLVVYMMH